MAKVRPAARWLPSVLGLAALFLAFTLVRGSALDERAQRLLTLLPGQPTGTQTRIDAFARDARTALADALPPGSSVSIDYTDLARLRTPEEQAKLRDATPLGGRAERS